MLQDAAIKEWFLTKTMNALSSLMARSKIAHCIVLHSNGDIKYIVFLLSDE